jgi:hypothetical protein
MFFVIRFLLDVGHPLFGQPDWTKRNENLPRTTMSSPEEVFAIYLTIILR